MKWILDGVDDANDPRFVEYRRELGFEPFHLINTRASLECINSLRNVLEQVQNIYEPDRVGAHDIRHSAEDLRAYYEIARGFHNDRVDGHVVQLGIYRGGSACAIALGLKEADSATPLVCVDNFSYANSPETTDDVMLAQKHLIEALGLRSHVVSVWHDSVAFFDKFWDFPIRFAFIDTNHSYEHTIEEIKVLEPHIVSGGWLGFHDYTPYYGVARAVHDWLCSANRQGYTLLYLTSAQWHSAFIQFP